MGILGWFFDRKVRGFKEEVAGRKSACMQVYAIVWDLQPKTWGWSPKGSDDGMYV